MKETIKDFLAGAALMLMVFSLYILACMIGG
jgi:hypothetical protein